MAFKPTVKTSRPFFEAKLAAGAISSVAAWTGTKSRVTQVTSSATAAQIGAALGALIDDLQTRGIIK